MSAELGAAAVEIDAGAAAATLSACLGGWQHQDDYAQLTLQFFTEPEAGGTFFPARQVIGPKAAARGNKTKLLPVARTVQVPPGARSAVILLTAQRVRGLYNDGYADNLSLTLGPSPGPAPPASSCLAPAGNDLRRRRRHERPELRQVGPDRRRWQGANLRDLQLTARQEVRGQAVGVAGEGARRARPGDSVARGGTRSPR